MREWRGTECNYEEKRTGRGAEALDLKPLQFHAKEGQALIWLRISAWRSGIGAHVPNMLNGVEISKKQMAHAAPANFAVRPTKIPPGFDRATY
ncbi:MAG: hypothetical protein JOY54_02760 [Acidobacteriaceae bacterium]|nr:hypothetical protein [Acidobacteriaceae bacterium]